MAFLQQERSEMGSRDLKTQAYYGREAGNFLWFLRGGKTLHVRKANTAVSFWWRILPCLSERSSSNIHTGNTNASLTLQSNSTKLKKKQINKIVLISKLKLRLTLLICNPQISPEETRISPANLGICPGKHS